MTATRSLGMTLRVPGRRIWDDETRRFQLESDFDAYVVVTVDLEGLARLLGPKAVKNRSGRSKALGGFVKVVTVKS